jgi:hypothetical protein
MIKLKKISILFLLTFAASVCFAKSFEEVCEDFADSTMWFASQRDSGKSKLDLRKGIYASVNSSGFDQEGRQLVITSELENLEFAFDPKRSKLTPSKIRELRFQVCVSNVKRYLQ